MATVLLGGTALAQDEEEADGAAPGEEAAEDGGTRPDLDDPATARARKHFHMGVDFYREGDYAGALVQFKRAYETAPHYKVKFNLGKTALKLQDYVYAIDNLNAYLEEGGDEVPEERRRDVEGMIEGLRDRLAFVTIRSNQDDAEVYVDDRLIGRTPFADPVPIGAGRRHIVAHKDGYVTVERRLDLAARDELKLTMDFDERPRSTKVVVTKVVNEDISPVLWMGIGTGVLAAGTATLAILTAMAKEEHKTELARETTLERLETFEKNARTRALLTDIGLGLTGAAAVSTLVVALLLADDDGESAAPTATSELALTPSLVSDGERTQVSLSGSF